MLEMNCYKMFRTAKMFSESEIACQLEGGMVAKPMTLLQVRIYKCNYNDMTYIYLQLLVNKT